MSRFPQDDQELLEKLRAKLGTPKKVDERAELERLFGKTAPTAEDALREKLVKNQPVLVKGDIIDLYIEKLSFGGEGIGKHKNAIVFVPDTVPGDTAKVRIDNTNADFYRGHLMEIVARSSDRILPNCPVFSRCGGCHLLHLSYTAQLRAKRQIIEDAVKPLVQEPSIVRAPIASPDAFSYRLRAKIQVDPNSSPLRYGFFARKSHDLIDLRNCPLLAPLLNRTLAALSTALPAPLTAPIPSEIHLHANAQGDQIALSFESDKPIYLTEIFAKLQTAGIPVTGMLNHGSGRTFETIGDPSVLHRVGGIDFLTSAGSFFQSNRHLLKSLLDQALMLASPNLKDHILDLYCGVGFFSIGLGRFAHSITGVDLDAASISFAERNAQTAGVSRSAFYSGADSTPFRLPDPRLSLLVIDPPRNGVSPTWMKQIRDLRAAKLLYVSCNPPTFARDLGLLMEEGYKLRVIQPIDLFPNTYHIEVMAFLTHPLTHIQAASAVIPDLR